MSRTESSRDRRFRNVSSWLAALLGALGAAGCAHSRFEAIDLGRLPGSDAYPRAEGVILFEESVVTFREEDRDVVIEQTNRHARRVLKDGGRWLGEVTASYSDLVELVDFAARVTRPDGEVREYTREDAHDLPNREGFVLFDDDRHLVLDLSSEPLGSVVELTTTHRYRDPRHWALAFGFGDGVPTARARFEVRLPEDWEVAALARRLDEDVHFPPVVSREGEERVLVWERTSIPAVPDERRAPSRYRGTSVRVQLTRWRIDGVVHEGIADATALSRFEHELTADRAEVNAELEAIAREVLKGAPADPYERARRLYAWTQEHVAYCAIEIGMGGFVPHPSSKTEAVRYGDCKDKANLLKSLLKTQGIGSRLASLYHHRGMPRRFGLPTLAGNANHMILIVDLPGGEVACDPTSRVVPFGRLPAGDQGADLLPASKEGSPLITTPWSSPDDNGHRFVLDADLRPGQALRGTFSIALSGMRADDVRQELLGATVDKHRDIINETVPVYSTVVEEVRVEDGVPPPLDVVPVRATGRINARAVPTDGGRVLFRLADFIRDAVPSLPPGKRQLPVVLGTPERVEDTLRLVLPVDASVGDLPRDASVESRFGRYQLSYRVAGGLLEIHRVYERRVPVVPAAEYDALRSFFSEVLSVEALPIVLRLGAGEEAK